MTDRMFEGSIDKWVSRVGSGYGFIAHECGTHLDRVYFDHAGIVPNNIGLRSHGKVVGNQVRFRLAKYTHRNKPSVKAVEVESISCQRGKQAENARDCNPRTRHLRSSTNFTGNPTYQDLTLIRGKEFGTKVVDVGWADAGRPIRQISGRYCIAPPPSARQCRTSYRACAERPLSPPTCTAQQVLFSSHCPCDPSTRNVFKREVSRPLL